MKSLVITILLTATLQAQELPKALLVLSLGVVEPITSGVFEAYTFTNRQPAKNIINTGNDHAWLAANRTAILGGAISGLFWGKNKPKKRDVIFTAIGTLLVADGFRNLAFRYTQTGNAFYDDYFPDWRNPRFRGAKIDGKIRLLEIAVGMLFVGLSEL